jgi:hypothetical protein
MTKTFAVTFDYLCPFARNAAEGIVGGVREGRDWEPHFVPFSLSQIHVEQGDSDVWDRPFGADGASGVRALCWGLAVRALYPDSFLDYHVASFSARHDDGADINDPGVLAAVASSVGVDPDAVAAHVDSGAPRQVLGDAYTEAVKRWNVLGVPTFMQDGEAVFVRLMERGRADDVERVLDMLSWSRLSEFKRTSVPR